MEGGRAGKKGGQNGRDEEDRLFTIFSLPPVSLPPSLPPSPPPSQNTDPNAKILSWWDYGYQMSAMANRTVIVDNNTWNNTHIATVRTPPSLPPSLPPSPWTPA